jgi:hypothetical protein
MKSLLVKFILWSFAGTCLLTSSCDDEDRIDVVVDFRESFQILEEGEEGVFQLDFSRPAGKDGYISLLIKSTCVYGVDYETQPARDQGTCVLPVKAGDVSATVKMRSIENSLLEDTKSIEFSLSSFSPEFVSGEKIAMTVLIGDNESPAFANFTSNGGSIKEKSTAPIDIEIQFTKPMESSGSLTISFFSDLLKYGVSYTTIPAATGSTITLNVLAGESTTHFTVIPLHDNVFSNNAAIPFTLAASGGGLKIGDRSIYSLTIINEDPAPLVNFVTQSMSISESSESILVEIGISPAASAAGNVTLTYGVHGAEYNVDFKTDPAPIINTMLLPIAKGQSSVTFKILPVDNLKCSALPRTAYWTIQSVSAGLQRGSELYFEANFVNNDVPKTLTFAESSAVLNESNAAGIPLTIKLTSPHLESFWVGIVASDYNASKRYKMLEPLHCDYYGYTCNHYNEFLPATTELTFRVFPVDNSVKANDYVVNFTFYVIFGADDCLQVANNTKFTVTIVDDD